MSWNCGFRQSFRLLHAGEDEDLLDVFLSSHGRTENEVLDAIPRPRSAGGAPDAKRYREPRQLFRTTGLLYDRLDGGERRVVVTELGHAVRRWRPNLTEENASVLGRFAALALSACQLRNPSKEAKDYPVGTEVFPFAFIWRAMPLLDGRISSDELNRGVLHAMSQAELDDIVDRLKHARRKNDHGSLRPPLVDNNDRLIPWMAWASFGWTLISPKEGSGFYAIRPRLMRIVADAASIKRRHHEFGDEAEYIEYVVSCAALPKDLR